MHLTSTRVPRKTNEERLADSAVRALNKLESLAPEIRARPEFDLLAIDAERVKEREQAFREALYV